jgi:hypothetical protein
MSRDSIEIRNKSILRKRKKAIQIKQSKCPHKKTVALNEEGHAGVYCCACGEKLEDAC